MESAMIFETHAHYDDEAFAEDRDELLASLGKNKIEAVVNVAAGLASVKTTIALTKAWPFVYGAAGVHPSETAELDEADIEWLAVQCTREKIVAVGEIGLDYYWDEPDRETQKYWFRRQLQMARKANLPVIIHSRDAARDTLDIMREEKAEELSGVIHCFSYSKETAAEFIHMGYYFGIGGVITFANAKKLKEAVAAIPMERILLETDAPYLAPVPNRGKRNSSLNLPFVAEKIGEIKGLSYEEVVRITNENARKLFRL